ncbi:MAG: DUF2203 domain-containing protein [Myxococcota bacterium]|nr:DUF2203 domain-containing protein [Myxococcota bacterium]
MSGSATAPILTLEAVNALVPRLRSMMEAQMERRSEIERRLEQLAALIGQVPEAIQIDDRDSAPLRELKRDLLERVARYQSAWGEFEDIGAVLKDARRGLVDFYGHVDGRLVWLCWKFGEDAIAHYHGLDEGFSRRRPIEAPMRQRHLN